MKKILISLGLFACILTADAANFVSGNFLRGTNLIVYTGTSATTFKYDDTYATNRSYVNMLGTTVIPLATNSVTGGIVPSFEKALQGWSDANGNFTANTAIYVQAAEGAAFTNTVAITFVRSVDGGLNYPTDDTTSLFTFTFDPVNNGIVTNVPTAFLTGTSHIRLWKLVSAANPVGASTVTLKQVRLSGFVP